MGHARPFAPRHCTDPARALSLALRLAAAAGWSGSMVLAGLWSLLAAPRRWPLLAEVWLLAGTALLAGGQFVFMVLFADRTIPTASRRLTVTCELASLAVFVAALGGVMWVLPESLP